MSSKRDRRGKSKLKMWFTLVASVCCFMLPMWLMTIGILWIVSLIF